MAKIAREGLSDIEPRVIDGILLRVEGNFGIRQFGMRFGEQFLLPEMFGSLATE